MLCQVDRPSVTEQRCDEVQSNLFDLFAHLGATDEQLDFTTLYASAREVRQFCNDMPAGLCHRVLDNQHGINPSAIVITDAALQRFCSSMLSTHCVIRK